MTSDEPEQPFTADEEGDAPSKSKTPQETKPQGPLVNVDIKATATDVFGFGEAAKTPAGEAVARGLLPALGYILVSGSNWAFGRRNARIEAERIVLTARANAQARLIEVQSQQQIDVIGSSAAGAIPEDHSRLIEGNAERLRNAAGERIIATEVRRQENIEAILKEAVDLADGMSTGTQPSEIPEDFAFRVTEAASKHSAPNVRSIFARLIASRVNPDSVAISNPSIELLESLDGPLALAFEKFVCKVYQYENHPPLMTPNKDGYRNYLPMLREIGILTDKYVSKFDFCGFYLYALGPAHEGISIPVPTLSVRGQEIADAVFDDKYIVERINKDETSGSELFRDISAIIDYYFKAGVKEVELGVGAISGSVDYFIVRNKMEIDLVKHPGVEDLFILRVDQFAESGFDIDNRTKSALENIIAKYTIQKEQR